MTEIRGVWIANRPHSKVLESRDNIIEAMDFLQSSGFNVIFPVVWNRGYTLYPSRVMAGYDLPPIEPYYRQQQRDPLAEIIAEAHQRNFKVIPWLEYGFAASHLLSGGQILQQYLAWRGVDRNGELVRHGGLTWMNAFDPRVQQFMLEIIAEIVSKYNVDGIQGCDRLPALPATAGYDRYTVELYQTAFGKLPPKNHQDRQWIQWRADLLTDFAAKMYRQVKAIAPETIVSLSPGVYPFCLHNLLQDSLAWVERRLCDWIHPQLYRSSFSGYNREVKKIGQTFSPDSFVKFAPGIALTANGKDLTTQDLIKCIKTNRDRQFSGQILFHYEGLRAKNNAVAIALSNGLYL